MKKRLFAFLLCGVVVCNLVGCGESGSSSGPSSDEVLQTESVAEEIVGTEAEPNFDDIAAESVAIEDERDEESLSTEIGEDVSEVIEPVVEEPRGIIIAQRFDVESDTNGITSGYAISQIDPATGEASQLAEFQLWTPWESKGNDYYLRSDIARINPSGDHNCQMFSSDLSKMAVTKHLGSKEELHAGWIDQQGNFFDVTEVVGEASSDFGDPVSYRAAGFTDDGKFVYYESEGNNWRNADFRYVEVADPNTSFEGNPFLGNLYVEVNGRIAYMTTDWLDATHCLVDAPDKNVYVNTYIFDTNTQEISSYLPGETRSNWNAIISPDGSQIAFLSAPRNTADAQLFIVPVSGETEPQLVDCDISFGRFTYTWGLLGWK